MSEKMITPWQAFIDWFDTIPLSLRKFLAHAFRVCTTEDTAQMAASPDESLWRFRNWAGTTDFPLRIAARIFYIRSVFDMVIYHHDALFDQNSIQANASFQDNIVPISSKQWDAVYNSWTCLRNRELTDTYVHSWASWMIKKQMKPIHA